MANDLNNLPASLEPIATSEDGRLRLLVPSVWYKFFVSIASVLGNFVGGVLGFTVEAGAEATGTVQADALPMSTEWIVVDVTPVGSGVLVFNFGPGVVSTVFNRGANALKVYPPVGTAIDALGTNNPYTLAAGKMQAFHQVEDLQFLSTQLG